MAAQSPAATPTLNKMLRAPAQTAAFESAGSPVPNHNNHSNHVAVSSAYDLKQYNNMNAMLNNNAAPPPNQAMQQAPPPNVLINPTGDAPPYHPQHHYRPPGPHWAQQPGAPQPQPPLAGVPPGHYANNNGNGAHHNQPPTSANNSNSNQMAPMSYSYSLHATTSVTNNNQVRMPLPGQHEQVPTTSAAVQGMNGTIKPTEHLTNGPLPPQAQQAQQQAGVGSSLNGVCAPRQVQVLQGHPTGTPSPVAVSMSPSSSVQQSPMPMSPNVMHAAPATPTSAPPKKSVGRPKKVKVPPQATPAPGDQPPTQPTAHDNHPMAHSSQQQQHAMEIHRQQQQQQHAQQQQQYQQQQQLPPYGAGPPQHPQYAYAHPGQAGPPQYQPRPGMYVQQQPGGPPVGYPQQVPNGPGGAPPPQYGPGPPASYGTPPRRQMTNGPSPSAQNGKNGGLPGSKDVSLPSTPGAQSPGGASDTLDTSNSQSQWSQPPRARATPNGAPATPGSTPSQQAGGSNSTESVVDRLTGPIFNMEPPVYQQRRYFYEQLIRFNEAKGTPITTQPTVSKQSVDLYRLYLAVRDRGGFETVTKAKQWKDLCPVVMAEMAVSSAAGYQLRKHYTTYLLTMECHDTGRNYNELIDFSEKQKKVKKRKPTKAEERQAQQQQQQAQQATGATPPAHDSTAAANALAAGVHPGFDPSQQQHPAMQHPSQPQHPAGAAGVPPPGWQQAPPYGHPGIPQARWGPHAHVQQSGAGPNSQYPPSQATPPAYAQLGAPQRMAGPNSGVMVRDPFDDRSQQMNGTLEQQQEYQRAQAGNPPGAPQPPPPPPPQFPQAQPPNHEYNQAPSTSQAQWQQQQQQQSRLPAGVHVQQPQQPGVRMMSGGKPMPIHHAQSWPRPAQHPSLAPPPQQQMVPLPVRRIEPAPISFPAGCVEATTMSTRKRRKIRARDVGKVDAWRLVMALRSGLHAESHWAINLLNVLLYDDSAAPFFNLRALPGLLEVLIEHLRRLLIELFPNEGFEQLEAADESENAEDPSAYYSSILHVKSEPVDTDQSENPNTRLRPMKTAVRQELNQPGSSGVRDDKPVDYTHMTRTGREVHVDVPQCSTADDEAACTSQLPQRLCKRMKRDELLSNATGANGDGDSEDTPVIGLCSTHLCSKTWPHAYDQSRLTFNRTGITADRVDSKCEQHIHIVEQKASACPFYHREPVEREVSEYANAECTAVASCTLVNEQTHTQHLLNRCLAVSNAIRGLSFVPHNDAVMSKCSVLMALMGRLLLLQHTHHTAKVMPTLAQTLPADTSESSTTNPSESSSKYTTSASSYLSSTAHVNNNLLRCADQLRDDAFVVICQLSCTVDLNTYDSTITHTLLSALLHWSICASPCANDASVPGSTSPLMYSLEVLCKISVIERNVDLLMATGPWPRLERFMVVLGELLSLGQEVHAREFALVLVQALSSVCPGLCHVLATRTPAVHHLVAFLELHDSNMHQVVQTSGMQALRENPERMGTSVGMLRRAASVLQHMAKLADCRTPFKRHQQRLLQFTMSQLMDSRVASIIADTLYELNKQELALKQQRKLEDNHKSESIDNTDDDKDAEKMDTD